MKIAVLALQGAFIEHIHILKNLGIDAFELRQKKDLDRDFNALILPGGESTVIAKLLYELDMFDTIKNRISDRLPVFGTCAGMILLASQIEGSSTHLGTMNITVVRNAYGRQLGSFNTVNKFNSKDIEMRFIRAPYVKDVSQNIEVLSIVDNKIVAVREGNQLAVAFHPELTKDYSVHKYFLNLVSKN